VLLVIFALASNILGAWRLSETLRKRVEYGETDKGRWRREFDEFSNKSSPWPFTKEIEGTGRWMRIVKGALTLAAGALLITGAILK